MPFRRIMLIAVLAVSHAHAQAIPDLNRDRPVDNFVEDLSLRNASRRHIERGNALFNPNVTMYRPHREPGFIETGQPVRDPVTGLVTPHRFVYRAPGVQARLNQPDYLVMNQFNVVDRNVLPLHDGQVRLQRPLDVVFDLIPHQVAQTQAPPTQPWADHRLDPRLDGRLQTRRATGETPYQTTVILRPLPRHDDASPAR